MVPQDGLIVDHTPQGNNGTPGAASVVENSILGPLRRYAPNPEALRTDLGAANAFALSDVTMSFWLRRDAGAADSYAAGYVANAIDQWSVNYSLAGAISIYDDINNVNTLRYSIVAPDGALHYVVAVMDSLENLLYIDGVLVGSGESSLDDWSSYAGVLHHGGRRVGGVNGFSGCVGSMLIHNVAKDQDWVTQEYLKGAQACQFKTGWGVRESLGNEVANSRVGVNSSPFEILSGAWQMSMDTVDGQNVKVIECVTNGGILVPTSLFEATATEAAYGTWEWWFNKTSTGNVSFMFTASAESLIGGGTQDGYLIEASAGELYYLRRVDNGVRADLMFTAGGVVPTDSWNKSRTTRRYDGSFTMYLNDVAVTPAGGTNPITDATYTISNYMVIEMERGDKIAYSDQRGDHSIVKYLGVIAP